MSEELTFTNLKNYIEQLPKNNPVDFYLILDHFQVNPYSKFELNQKTTDLETIFDRLRVVNYDEVINNLKNIIKMALDHDDYDTTIQSAQTGQRLQNSNALLYLDINHPKVLTYQMLSKKLQQLN